MFFVMLPLCSKNCQIGDLYFSFTIFKKLGIWNYGFFFPNIIEGFWTSLSRNEIGIMEINVRMIESWLWLWMLSFFDVSFCHLLTWIMHLNLLM